MWVAITPFIARPFLDAAVGNLDDASAGAVIGSFFAVLLLFAPAVVLLGMVSPFAIRLAITDVETAGAVAGRFYALSTAGSLLGTFVPALVAIPLVGTQRTLLGTAALLALSASFLLGRRVLVARGGARRARRRSAGRGQGRARAAARGGLALPVHPGRRAARRQAAAAPERGRRRPLGLARATRCSRAGSGTRSWRCRRSSTGRCARSRSSATRRARPRGRSGVFYPEARVDGVELDPAVSRVGRRYFGLEDNPRLTVHDADARPFLRRTDERYDLIVVDAYHQPYVPFYLATREFFRLARERLEPGGILALNVASVPGDESLLDGISGTLTLRVPVGGGLAGAPLQQDPAGVRPAAAALAPQVPQELEPLWELLRRGLRPVTHKAERPWTDDRAPVEWVTDRMIVEYAARGGELDEDFLPTAP